MENQNNVTSTEMEEMRKQFANYQKSQTPTKRKSSEELLKKYFHPRNTKETFRILPLKPGEKVIKEAFFHPVAVNGSGGKKKNGTVIYCPAHNDPKVQKIDSNGNPAFDMSGNKIMVPAPCPLCDKHKKLINQQDQSIKYIKKENMTPQQLKIKEKNDKIYKEAVSWEAKKFYIIKGVDKGQEKDGVKFWRFKHNFKKQGTWDKLLPVLDDYMQTNGVLFCDKDKGCDLSITMADTEMKTAQGIKTYKQITAITPRQPSPLHSDPIVAKQWMEDEITWRDVFFPKKAPNITPYDYLVMIVNDETPYWDDSDQDNKHWVFPNNPELEELANTRKQNLDSDVDENYEYASDVDEITISNVEPSNVGVYRDNSVDVGKVVLAETKSEEVDEVPEAQPAAKHPTKKTKVVEVEDAVEESNDYNDLPF